MNNSTSEFEQLVDIIIEKNRNPEDHYEVVALLESIGWNDTRASARFGTEDLFDLGRMVYTAIIGRGSVGGIASHQKVGLIKMTFVLIKSFIRGTIFALPMVISVVSMLSLKISLWSYQYLSTELATSIAIATILSFITVGGFTQAIARRGYFYISQNYYNMARKMTFKFIRLGYLAAILIMLGLFLFNLFFNFFPLYMMVIITLYYLMLCAIWLSVTVMYILQKEIFFTGLLSFGIGLVYVLFYILKLEVILAQIIALLVVSALGLIYVVYYFRKVELQMEKGLAVKLPRMSITVYSIMPYFVYGLVYFAFLYIDRLMAWSTNDQFMPFLIWFRGEYELGLDFGLLALLIPMGINEVIVNQFALNLEYSEKSIMGSDAEQFNRFYLNLYRKNFLLAIVVSIISAIFIFFLVRWLNEAMVGWGFVRLINSGKTWFVFYCSLVAYSFVSVGLLNSVTLFSLSNPAPINHAVLLGFLTNALIGFLLSRWISYEFAVIGLVLGSIVFCIFSSVYAFRTLAQLDYHIYYAS